MGGVEKGIFLVERHKIAIMEEKKSDTYSLRVSPVKVEYLKQLAAKYESKEAFVEDNKI